MNDDLFDEGCGSVHVHTRHRHGHASGVLVSSLRAALLCGNGSACKIRAWTEFWRVTGRSGKFAGKCRSRQQRHSQKNRESVTNDKSLHHYRYSNSSSQRNPTANSYISGTIGGSCTLAARFSLVPRSTLVSSV